MRSAGWFVLAAVSACTQPHNSYDVKARCGGLRQDWISLDNSSGFHLRMKNKLHLAKDNRLLWNEAPVSEGQLRSYLRLSGSDAFPVPPVLHLVVDEGASCDWVSRVRSDVTTQQGCGHENCLEYAPTEWEKGAAPPR